MGKNFPSGKKRDNSKTREERGNFATGFLFVPRTDLFLNTWLSGPNGNSSKDGLLTEG